MLTETFIASVGEQINAHRTDTGKDATIVLLEHQPIVQIKSFFKKSVTPPHCLAASTSHIFAAQHAKAVVNVYSRAKGNQEATVPFPERVSSIALACADTVLILSTFEGKIFLWDITSGRQVHTTQAHLQAITNLAVDSTSNFLISVSADSTAQVWSIPSLLSFETSIDARLPLSSFTAHQSSITSIALGHSATHQNFAATISEDKTCLLWNYYDNSLLATLLLAHTPVAVQVDAADRAIYVGFDDGSLQQIDLYEQPVTSRANVGSSVQPGERRRWRFADNVHGAICSMAMSFDSTSVLTGHQSGDVLIWDVATGHARALALQPGLPGPVTNIQLLESPADTSLRGVDTPVVVKPKFGASTEISSNAPLDFTMHVQFTLPVIPTETAFQRAVTSTTIPGDMLQKGLEGLSQWTQTSHPPANGNKDDLGDDFMALDEPEREAQATLADENVELKRQLASLRQVQAAMFDRMDRLSAERSALLQREEARLLKLPSGSLNENAD